MTEAAARTAAQTFADEHGHVMAAVLDPIGNADDDEHGHGAWGYCPASALPLLHRYAQRVCLIHPGAGRPAARTTSRARSQA